PSMQGGQTPPQSTSLSDPFFIVSSHAGAAHIIVLQMPLTQSWSTAHVFPVPQPPQDEPPQSTSVSDPFSTRSAQAAGTQIPERQSPSSQSVLRTQRRPVAHGGQSLPQS